MTSSVASSSLIKALPTKRLFIEMLTKDIDLIAAIVDLVDNCTDGARRCGARADFKGFWARLTISPDKFQIQDNCGGIRFDVAQNYAFMFGRDNSAPSTQNSVGEFGVGMKRAIFKLGRQFEVLSSSEDGEFTVSVDVDTWAAAKDDWQFSFKSKTHKRIPESRRGTTITVKRLNTEVASAVGLQSFRTQLNSQLKERLQLPLSQGFRVTLNDSEIKAESWEFLIDSTLCPAKKRIVHRFPNGSQRVVVRLFCGLGKVDDPTQSGWQVFCNGRLVVSSDKSAVTGWGLRESAPHIPSWHNQYVLFRGIAFFEAASPGLLPWNTTKTGLDIDSALYKTVRQDMVILMRPVINFLNALKTEKERKSETGEMGPLELLVDRSDSAPISSNLPTRSAFKMPAVSLRPPRKKRETRRISYEKPEIEIKAIMQRLKVKTLKEVGERTFEYFLQMEELD
jgi:hypothetical protein